jgi:hypothetical protein
VFVRFPLVVAEGDRRSCGGIAGTDDGRIRAGEVGAADAEEGRHTTLSQPRGDSWSPVPDRPDLRTGLTPWHWARGSQQDNPWASPQAAEHSMGTRETDPVLRESGILQNAINGSRVLTCQTKIPSVSEGASMMLDVVVGSVGSAVDQLLRWGYECRWQSCGSACLEAY